MRKIIAKMHVTLDGLVCGVNEELDWAMPNATESLPDVQEFLKSVDTMILGRVTYEGLMPYWVASARMVWLNASMPNLAMEYGNTLGAARMPEMEPMFTMMPLLRSRMRLTAARAHITAPRRLTPTMRS